MIKRIFKHLNDWWGVYLIIISTHCWTYRIASGRGFRQGVDSTITELRRIEDKSKKVKENRLYFIKNTSI
jgi:hypothetical protein